MPKYGILMVEGPHDEKFVRRLLKPLGLKAIRHVDDLDDFFTPMIPDYPPSGNIEERVPIPAFFGNEEHVIAVRMAGGDSQLVPKLEELTIKYDFDDFAGVGVLLDKDLDSSVEERFKAIREGFEMLGILMSSAAGEVTRGTPNRGAFVLPDNNRDGALEDILLDIAATTYPALLESAEAHVAKALADNSLKASDKSEIKRADDSVKESGKKKAIVSSITAILKPGRTVSVSLQDNRWLKGDNLNRPEIKAVQQFLVELFDLTPQPVAEN